MKRSNFWAKFATALITLSLTGGAIVVTSCGDDSKIETPDNPDDPDNPDNPDNPDGPGDETTTATVTLNTPEVDGTTVTWTGKLEVKGSGTVEAGVSYSESNKPNVTGDPDIVTVQKAGTPDASGNFTVTVSGLIKDHTYYYCSYYKIDGKYTFGNVTEFKTGGDVYNENAEIDMNKAEDLSASETANCYIVTKAGSYKFKAVKGNDQSQTLAGAKAEILWESFCTDEMPEKGSIVSGVSYKDGYVGFTTPSTYTKGNALVALKDASGTIVWSWHIWLTDQPAEHVYRNNAGTMMDRNLGAIEAGPATTKTLGLLYQWGRKDPFMGCCEADASNLAVFTGEEKIVSCTETTGTIEYATANPQTYIQGNWDGNAGKGSSDWLYDDRSSDAIKDVTRWQRTKTIYDPCPAGWRVPDGGEDGIWAKAGFSTDQLNNTKNGVYFTLADGSKTWYPTPGFREYSGDNRMKGGMYGEYWSADVRYVNGKPGGYVFCFRISFDPNVAANAVDSSARWLAGAAFSVRCQKIQ
ncbi:MAG: hypothetical protein ACI3ZP_10445 [Candidatus Cryptobacteroides sp.]